MSIFDFLSGQFIDVIHWTDDTRDTMVWRFQRHGNWAVFMCRFFAGVRIPGYFLAGTMGMSYGRFLLLESAADRRCQALNAQPPVVFQRHQKGISHGQLDGCGS